MWRREEGRREVLRRVGGKKGDLFNMTLCNKRSEIKFICCKRQNMTFDLTLHVIMTMYIYTGLVSTITPHGLKMMREMVNDCVLDVFYYFSPKYGPEVSPSL